MGYSKAVVAVTEHRLGLCFCPLGISLVYTDVLGIAPQRQIHTEFSIIKHDSNCYSAIANVLTIKLWLYKVVHSFTTYVYYFSYNSDTAARLITHKTPNFCVVFRKQATCPSSEEVLLSIIWPGNR